MVNVNVKFSAIFKNMTGTTTAQVKMDGKTVSDLISELIDRYGEEFEKRIIDEETGKLRRFVNIFVNGKDIRNLDGGETKLTEDDEVRVIPGVAGGWEEFGFTDDQIKRYSRQIILPEVGGKKQSKLRDSSVLIIGAGGLGSPAAIYLAAAGIGKLGLVDDDKVDLSNLQRQTLHFTSDIGKMKTTSGKETVREINPEVEVETINEHLDQGNVFDILEGWDIVVDGSDNFPTKFLLNDACVLQGIPLSYGGVLQFTGMVTTILPKEGPCYRCLTPEAPPPGMIPTCQEAGVLGVVPGIVGSIQANEALKYLLEIGDLLIGRLLIFDALETTLEEFEFKHNPECPLCGKRPSITDLSKVDYGHVCEVTF